MIASSQRRALPPSAGARVEHVADAVPLAGIRAPGVADGASRRFRRLAERLGPVLAARRVHANLRLRRDVERRREQAAVLQVPVQAVRRSRLCWN